MRSPATNTAMLPIMVRSQQTPKRLSGSWSRQRAALRTIQSKAAPARSRAPGGSRRRAEPRRGKSYVNGAWFKPTRPVARPGIGASHCRARARARQRLTKQAPSSAKGTARLATSRLEEKSLVATLRQQFQRDFAVGQGGRKDAIDIAGREQAAGKDRK